MTTKHYAAIILAAGLSSRMHCFKPLLPLGEKTVADQLIETFLNNDVEVHLVAGYCQKELQAGILNQNIHIVEHPNYSKGMFTSVQAGLRSLGDECKAVFVAPVDTPLIRPYTIHRLLTASNENSGKLIYPVLNHERGHPPLLPADIIQPILNNPEGGNLESILSDKV
jgi:CTP:molybdopterin cytidylyltransferase MocA